jgi:ribose/xylose/arabinose/galactoside ABC-type transport system permease subunit
VHLVKAKARLLSSALTGTMGNPILSVLEDIVAVVGVVLSVLMPVLGLVVFAMLCWWVLRRWRRRAPVEAAG